MDQELELRQILQEAPTRWFHAHEIKKILTNYEKFELRNSPPDRPVSGSTFLYDRVSNKSFRKDGYSWKKKKDGVTVNEKVEHLKIDGVAVIRYYVARAEDNDKFQRRCYWFEDKSSVIVDIGFVHYRDTTQGYKLECVSTLDSILSKSLLVEVEKSLPVEVEKSLPVEVEKSLPVEVEKSLPVEVEKSLPVEANRRGKPLRVDKKQQQQQQQVPKKESAPMGKRSFSIDCELCGSAVKSEAAFDRHIEAHMLEIRKGVQLEHWDKEMFSLMKNQIVAAGALSHSGSPCEGPSTSGRE